MSEIRSIRELNTNDKRVEEFWKLVGVESHNWSCAGCSKWVLGCSGFPTNKHKQYARTCCS